MSTAVTEHEDGRAPLIPTTDLPGFYDARYEGAYQDAFDGGELLRLQNLRSVLKGLQITPARILDAGCGRGRNIPLLKAVFPEARIVGSDISPVAVEYCRRAYPDCDFQVGTDETLPFADDAFDLVISVEVMEHVLDIRQFLGEVRRVTSGGGLYVYTTPCANAGSAEWVAVHLRWGGVQPTRDGYRRWFYEEPGHLRRLTSGEAQWLLEEQGFEKVWLRFWSHYLGALNWRFADLFRRPGRRFHEVRQRFTWVASVLDALAAAEWSLLSKVPSGASQIGVFRKR